MSRLRKFDRNILWNGASDTDDNQLMGPLDTEEQEELIQKFELSNTARNKGYVNILSLCYMMCSGVFLILASNKSGKEKVMFALCTQALICSMINVRYELRNDFIIFRKIKVHIENSTLQRTNVILIVLIEWIGLAHFEDHTMIKIFVQLPLILFVTAILIKNWSRDMADQLNQLRKMKYKYKNA
ncbi:hypothetical protein HG535_0E03510 [Zygotorulaspora mrakii]|uniref:Uncharacterized protein n=1 Tax=Zygotorulaspora mrakii TaxID=42260 RepID=A0A7H9B424_ZYGMR|nr:uncharacterized protein HG535_0E03510 [Zygotorulaspora mrakii]QLG73267.1 hypothetical protein HG535_0E03510 [Zygotorulaspora mrakii]